MLLYCNTLCLTKNTTTLFNAVSYYIDQYIFILFFLLFTTEETIKKHYIRINFRHLFAISAHRHDLFWKYIEIFMYLYAPRGIMRHHFMSNIKWGHRNKNKLNNEKSNSIVIVFSVTYFILSVLPHIIMFSCMPCFSSQHAISYYTL